MTCFPNELTQDDRRWPLDDAERARLATLLHHVPVWFQVELLKRRGFSCWQAVVPERRESVAAGIADDYRAGRFNNTRAAA